MVVVITEADLFFTSHPFVLTGQYSSSQLEALFGPSNRPVDDPGEYETQLLNDIWRKYCRVDLVKWDPVLDAVFFDYCSQKFTSLDELNERFSDYSLMALRRLETQLTAAYSRWAKEGRTDIEPFRILLERIRQKEQKAMSDVLVDSDF